MNLSKTGILLIAHGSPLLEEADALFAIAEELRRRLPRHIVEVAFLDFNEPRIEEGIRRLMEREIEELILVPYFLANGYLAQKALRQARKAVKEHRGVSVSHTDPIGFDRRLVEIVEERIKTVKHTQDF
jgi:sirohydrochlorin ferrochelatase